jgi:hypothetical protein
MADVMEIQQAFEHADHETASWTTNGPCSWPT